ncbi:MAG TPA: flagellar motor switch protein FliN [Firmicutes bacterium]|nr:flagellar motor switch protein FliN [Bacillota bacterium]
MGIKDENEPDFAGGKGAPPEVKEADFSTKSSPNLEIIMDFSLTLSVQLGKSSRNLKEVRGIRPGAVLELDRFISEPVDILINNRLIAQGEVVIVGEHFGIKIKHIINPIERVRKLG